MVLNIIGGAVGLYRIVPKDEAHVRIMGNKVEVFMSRTVKDKTYKPSYWIIPFITKIVRLPLTNIRIDVPDVKLNDSNMAKFMSDIVCFVNIENPMLAAERTGITVQDMRYEGKKKGVADLANDFSAIMESIGRTVATKQTILDIYKDRSKLDDAVTLEVQKVFPQWGLNLVDLEIKDIKDAPNSTIISDIEKKQAAVINADARVKIAEEKTRAEITEATKTKESELMKAQTEEEWKKRQVEKEQKIAIATQEKEKMEAEKAKEANKSKVEAQRELQVGTADVEKAAIEKKAQAEKIRLEVTAEGQARKTELEGEADAKIIKLKKVAEAEGIEKLAEAQNKFQEAAMSLEIVKATKDVQIAYAVAQQKAYEKANITIVAGSTQEVMSGGLLGKISVGPKEGMALKQFLEMNPELAGLLQNFKNKKSEKKDA